ncbi:hypothetical protein [Pseudomonas fluorescens]|uniref:hypothetical protein n=1 Tax=Pseudomonas fluorescens TaxID=294 RepID=UPI001BE59287|nr:hypothetical protein [Pseudomonas fluorescens]MBT2375317.1 hypothetical protein [Pseudomonas fluorescens]
MLAQSITQTVNRLAVSLHDLLTGLESIFALVVARLREADKTMASEEAVLID